MTLKIARYRFDARVTSPLRLPEYAGSTLRGAFGHALRERACITGRAQCGDCPHIAACAYTAVFAPADRPRPTLDLAKLAEIPAPYVIEPPPWGEHRYSPGDTLTFHMVLLGDALKHLALIISAWELALQQGLGADRGRAALVMVCHLNGDGASPVWSTSSPAIQPHVAVLELSPVVEVRTLSLVFTTPLRLQHQGRPLGPREVTPRAFMGALMRRSGVLAVTQQLPLPPTDGAALTRAADELVSRPRLIWRDWSRYSSRQQQSMALGGVTGEWTLEGGLGPYLPWLQIGQWLHVGKNASFGLGKYHLEVKE